MSKRERDNFDRNSRSPNDDARRRYGNYPAIRDPHRATLSPVALSEHLHAHSDTYPGRAMLRSALTVVLALASVASVAVTADAQRTSRRRDPADWLADCRRNGWGDRDRACDVRETTLPARGRLVVDGGENGGVSVIGWDRNEIRVVAKIEASARSEADARALLREIEVRTSSDVRAEGPRAGRGESWSVSFEMYVPRRTSLDLETRNGGVAVEDVESDIRFDAVNGGVSLVDVGGDVRGATQNGGLYVSLGGDRWRGAGLDVRTQNGGIRMDIPARYNADLETGTVNGGFDLDFPVTVSGRLGRTLSTRLGGGGAPVRVMTTNGGVSLRRR